MIIDLPALNGSGTDLHYLEKRYKSLWVDLDKKVPPPAVALSFRDGPTSWVPVCSLGNISLITGKAKSRKTTFTNMMVAAGIMTEPLFDHIRNELPENKRKVIILDTEMDEYHIGRGTSWITRLSEGRGKEHLKVGSIVDDTHQERKKLLEMIIERNKNIGIIVIDGIRDLLADPNDAKESNDLVTDLRRWSIRHQVHIICIIHENKGSNTIRGHLGTELQNKCETVFRLELVQNNKEISVVHPEMTRNKPFKPFAIYYDESEGLPKIDLEYEIDERAKSTKYQPKPPKKKLEDYTNSEHITYLKEVFSVTSQLRSSDLKANILDVYCRHSDFYKKDAERCTTYLVESGYIQHNKEKEKDSNKWRFWLTEKALEQMSIF